MMSIYTGLSMLAALLALFGLYRQRLLSPGLLVVLFFMLLTGNIEMLLTALTGSLPESVSFIQVASLDYATLLYNIGFLSIALGMRLGTRQMDIVVALADVSHQGVWISRCGGYNALRLYGILFLLSLVLAQLIHAPLTSLAQLLLPFLSLRFFPVFVLAYDYFRHGRGGVLLLGITAFEIVANLSFFSSFHLLFVVIACAILLSFMTGGRGKLLPALVAGVLMFTVLSVWSYIKSDFRVYISGNQIAQVDTRSTADKVDFALSQVQAMTLDDFQDGMNRAVSRVAYNGYFAATTFNIPEYKPFGHGEMLLTAIKNSLLPRFLFPGKPIIDDSVIAAELIGAYVSGAESAASINVGVIGELYADLGLPTMFLALLALGYLLARMEQYIFNCLGRTTEAFAFSAVFLSTFGAAVYSLPKFVGAMLYLTAAMILFFRYFYRQAEKI